MKKALYWFIGGSLMTEDTFVEKVTTSVAGLREGAPVWMIVERLKRRGIWIEDKSHNTPTQNPVVILVRAKIRASQGHVDQNLVDVAWEYFKTRDRRWGQEDRRRK